MEMKKRKKSLLGLQNSVRWVIKTRRAKKKDKGGKAVNYHCKTRWGRSKTMRMTRMRTMSTEKHTALLHPPFKEASCSKNTKKSMSRKKLREAFPSATDLPHAGHLVREMTLRIATLKKTKVINSKRWKRLGIQNAKNHLIRTPCSRLVIAQWARAQTTTYRLTHREPRKIQSFLTSSQSTAMKILPTISPKKALLHNITTRTTMKQNLMLRSQKSL